MSRKKKHLKKSNENKTSHYFEDETPQQKWTIKTWNDFSIFPYFFSFRFFPLLPKHTFSDRVPETLPQGGSGFDASFTSEFGHFQGSGGPVSGWFLKCQGLKGGWVFKFSHWVFAVCFFEIPVNFLVVFGWLGWLLQILSYYFVGCILFLKKKQGFFLAGDVSAVYVWESLARFRPLLMCWRDIVGTWVVWCWSRRRCLIKRFCLNWLLVVCGEDTHTPWFWSYCKRYWLENTDK